MPNFMTRDMLPYKKTQKKWLTIILESIYSESKKEQISRLTKQYAMYANETAEDRLMVLGTSVAAMRLASLAATLCE